MSEEQLRDAKEFSDYMLIPSKNLISVRNKRIVVSDMDGIVFLDSEWYNCNGTKMADAIKRAKK